MSQADLRFGEDFPPNGHEIQREVKPFRYLARQDDGLVETPLPQAFSVQRDRHDRGENIHIPYPAGKIGHDASQDIADSDPSPVLEKVDCLQERVFVKAYRPGESKRPLGDETFSAEAVFLFLGGEGDPAPGAERRADVADPGRALQAEGESAVFMKDFAARDAAGRKDHVGNPGHDLFQYHIPLVSAFRETVSSGTAIRGASDHNLSRS